MTQMMPPEIARYGYVTARVIRTIGDTTDDADEYPDAVGATGTIVFTPLVQRRRTSDYEAFVLHEPVTCTLDSDGVMHGPSGTVGVWLLAGDYLVKVVTAPAGWDDFTITVTVEHTVAAPLNLATAAPYQPAPIPAPVLMVAPPGGMPGQHLTPDAPGSTRLRWIDPDGSELLEAGPDGYLYLMAGA